MKKKSRNKFRFEKYTDLIFIAAVILVTIIFWNTWLLYPVKIFVVFAHEMSHAFAAIFTGGTVKSITITETIGGMVNAAGGVQFIVASAGYVGSILIGAALFFSAYDRVSAKWTCTILAVIIILFSANFARGGFTVLFALASSLFFIVLPRYPKKEHYSYIMKAIGIMSALYVMRDIVDDLGGDYYNKSDARALEMITGLSESFWGVVWFVITLTLFFLMIRHSFRKSFG